MSQSTEATRAWLARTSAALAAIDRLGVVVCADESLPDRAFSLVPGSVNVLTRMPSGYLYTGREMG